MKNMSTIRSKGCYKATILDFSACNNIKKKMDAIRITFFTLVYAKNAFRVIKNHDTTLKIVKASYNRYEEIKEKDCVNLLEKDKNSKMKSAKENLED